MPDAVPTPPAPVPAAPPPAPAQQAVPAAQPPTPPAGDDFRGMSREQFNARIADERRAGANEALKALGISKRARKEFFETRASAPTAPNAAPAEGGGLGLSDVLRAMRGEVAGAREQELVAAQQKIAAERDALKPAATELETIKKSLAGYLDAEEKAIPEAKRGLLELAPTEASARLAWIANAKSKGLFTDAAAAPSPAREPKPATTIGTPGPTPPKPAGTSNAYESYMLLVKEHGVSGSPSRLFYTANRTAIEKMRPKPTAA